MEEYDFEYVRKNNLIYTNKILNRNNLISIKLLCNWCTSEELSKIWEKMNPGDYVITTLSDNPDYFVIINAPPAEFKYSPEKTLVFRMEPNMEKNPWWGEFSNPNPEKFLKIFRHENDYNNIEWHLSPTWSDFQKMKIKKTRVLSTVISDKYTDPGHILRIDFVKHLDGMLEKGVMDIYGGNKAGFVNYISPLPYHKKDDGIFPYKYIIAVENHSICNYFTEKVIDGILGECLVFYWGCPNLNKFVPEDAFIRLDFEKGFEECARVIMDAIKNDLHSQRLKSIRKAKRKILNEMTFFDRVYKTVKK